ncbi:MULTISPECIES: YslB family protein [Mesobacillus]|uniref:DUF2507 domain-containing protein n=2 Tax=Mesobacillus TaxID=2675231 RepID=A0A0D6ZBE0_9BACI|nr:MULTISPECIES: YslB family protein [Mesobacillus]KIY22346.1 hypothetical protein UB32_09020 [Mesobacillus subterraneus]MDQ0412919.1 putative hydrocarbon binding protein [Mesobacillus stamsii]
MSETTTPGQKKERSPLAVSAFGYDLVREDLLNELLGKDKPEILYWAGKRLARKYPLTSMEETVQFFQDASWGLLTVKEESKREMLLELSSELISSRLNQNQNSTFQLEAGFIAQQIEYQKKVTAEAFEHPNKKSFKVQFTIKWDKTDIIE